MDDPAFQSLTIAWRILEQPWSRSPLYTETTLESDSRLAGEWREAGSEATWAFDTSERAGYRLIITEHGFSAAFEARTLSLGGDRFLDLLYEPPRELKTAPPEVKAEAKADAQAEAGEAVADPAPATPEPADPAQGEEPAPKPLGDVHVFFKFQAAGTRVILTPISSVWLKAGLESGDLDIRHEDTQWAWIILDASTDNLRAFVLRFADDPATFPGLDRGGLGFELSRIGPLRD